MENETVESVTEQKEIKRFEPKIEAKLLTKLNKILNVSQNQITEEDAITKDKISVIDEANICLIVAKTEEAKRVLSRFVNLDNENRINNIPSLDYSVTEEKNLFCRYDLDYLSKIIDLLKTTAKTIKMQMKSKYPITLESDDFMVILAPKIQEDD